MEVARPTPEVPTSAAVPTQSGHAFVHTLYPEGEPHASEAGEPGGQEERVVICKGLRGQALLSKSSNKTEGKSQYPHFQ